MDDEYDWQDSWVLTTGTQEQRNFYLKMLGETGKNKMENLKAQLNKLYITCHKCGGNFNDDCRDCPTLSKRCELYSELEKLKDKNMPRIEGEQTYFTAKDARKVSDEVSSSRITAEIDEVYKLINDARWEGENKVTLLKKKLMDSTIKFLEEKGFKVKIECVQTYNTIISW